MVIDLFDFSCKNSKTFFTIKKIIPGWLIPFCFWLFVCVCFFQKATTDNDFFLVVILHVVTLATFQKRSVIILWFWPRDLCYKETKIYFLHGNWKPLPLRIPRAISQKYIIKILVLRLVLHLRPPYDSGSYKLTNLERAVCRITRLISKIWVNFKAPYINQHYHRFAFC